MFPIGYPGGNAWLMAVQPHVVSSVTANVIRAEGNLVDGHSGGALVTEDGGIVGLVSSIDAVLGESQRIDRVVEKLAERGYRVSLLEDHDRQRRFVSGFIPLGFQGF